VAVGRKSFAVCATLALTVANAGAQAAPSVKLKPADAKLDEEFTQITSVRELSDGRVLVTDGRENRVVVADFKAGTVMQIGRNGQGPGEYQSTGMLRAIGGDSSLMVEARVGRWHLFDGARLAVTLPPDAPIVTAIGRNVTGADARGNVSRTIAMRSGTPIGGAGAGRGAGPAQLPGDLPDSAFVVRGNRSNARLDTLARVKARKMVMSTATNARGGVTMVNLTTPPLAVGEETALFADGWLAIVRLDPYRVDWVSPDGKTAKGDPLPWPVVKINDREREAYFMARSRDAARNSGGPIPESVRKQLEDASKLFPDTYPPTIAGGLITVADGRLLIRHPETADVPNPRYDLVDRRGRLAGTIAMVAGESILAITRTAAYVAWKDSDDIERLRRHPWP